MGRLALYGTTERLQDFASTMQRTVCNTTGVGEAAAQHGSVNMKSRFCVNKVSALGHASHNVRHLVRKDMLDEGVREVVRGLVTDDLLLYSMVVREREDTRLRDIA